MRRYCKDHAAQICGVEGFYLRNKMNDHGKWVVFNREFERVKVEERT